MAKWGSHQLAFGPRVYLELDLNSIEMSTGFDTIFPADTVEFCPHEGLQDLFVCGTYNLLQSTKPPSNDGLATPKAYRVGQCQVFRLQDPEAPTFEQIQTLEFPAIPDLKWCHGNVFERPTLAIADSEGSISICQWKEARSSLELVGSTRCADLDTLCLSLDWNNRIGPSTQPLSLAVSLSNGQLSYLQADENGNLRIIDNWHAHDYEPWIAAWHYHDPRLLFSGGDDLAMKLWDIRNGFNKPVTINKRFEAGVTTIQSHLVDANLIAVGSYDEKVRFFDTRNLLRPITELHVGGGVWRIKWHPSPARQHDLLVACMHDGFKVARYERDAEPSILAEFREHESLAYGADWSFSTAASSEPRQTAIASCSFYDHKLHIWTG